MRRGRYWEKESKRKCRLCGRREETREHMWVECAEWRNGNMTGDDGGSVRGGRERGRVRTNGKMRECEKEKILNT